jgi:cation:H+ antiporter
MILLYLAAFVAGLVVLEVGADGFTDRACELAERAGVSETLAGLLTVGIEWEELVVVLVAALSGRPGIAAGDVIGSCIANLGGSLGVGLLARPVAVGRDDRRIGWVVLGVTALMAASAWLGRGTISRPVGVLLVALFVAYLAALVWLFRHGLMQTLLAHEDEDNVADASHKTGHDVAKAFIGALGGLVLVVVGAELVVRGAVGLAHAWGMSEFVVGLTLVAFGTTLPDTVVNVIAARKESGGLVMANAAGSNICDLLFVLGLAAVASPLALDSTTLAFDLPFLLGLTLLVVVMQRGSRLVRAEGAVLLAAYAFYLLYNFVLKGEP